MEEGFDRRPFSNPVLRYMAILAAARDFGVSEVDLELVARQCDPWRTSPRELADALADRLLERPPAAA